MKKLIIIAVLHKQWLISANTTGDSFQNCISIYLHTYLTKERFLMMDLSPTLVQSNIKNACMLVCMCVYACAYVCVYVCNVYVCSMYVCDVCMYVIVCMYVCVYVCTCIFIHI